MRIEEKTESESTGFCPGNDPHPLSPPHGYFGTEDELVGAEMRLKVEGFHSISSLFASVPCVNMIDKFK